MSTTTYRIPWRLSHRNVDWNCRNVDGSTEPSTRRTASFSERRPTASVNFPFIVWTVYRSPAVLEYLPNSSFGSGTGAGAAVSALLGVVDRRPPAVHFHVAAVQNCLLEADPGALDPALRAGHGKAEPGSQFLLGESFQAGQPQRFAIRLGDEGHHRIEPRGDLGGDVL